MSFMRAATDQPSTAWPVAVASTTKEADHEAGGGGGPLEQSPALGKRDSESRESAAGDWSGTSVSSGTAPISGTATAVVSVHHPPGQGVRRKQQTKEMIPLHLHSGNERNLGVHHSSSSSSMSATVPSRSLSMSSRPPCFLWTAGLLLVLFGLVSVVGAFSNVSSTEDDQKITAPLTTVLQLPRVEPDKTVAEKSKEGESLNKKSSPAAVPTTTTENDRLGFWHAFFASLSVIIVSELGDKTWFIAAILAMRHSRMAVFVGAMSALAMMTVLSVCLGWATQVIPRHITYYVSSALFALFGLKMFYDGYKMSPNEQQEEYEEAQQEVQKKENEMAKVEMNQRDIEAGTSVHDPSNRFSTIMRFVSAIVVEAFTLTFIAEWGDRSQLTTIILAAREEVIGVTIGGIIGHAICTGIAVMGGRLVAQQISVRTVTLIGGVVFICFALSAVILNPDAS